MTPRGRASQCSICPICSCGCGLHLQQTDGDLSGVMPSEHHPLSGGRLCARGWAAHEPSIWGRRLTQPLVRNGGAQGPATWKQAMTAAEERLRALLDAGKPIGVLGSGRATNEENFLAVALARAALRTGHVDSCLRGPYQDLLSGIPPILPGQGSRPALADIEGCAVILLVEGDLALTHPQAAYAILKAVRGGARLVTVGPVKTQLSRLAWKHLPLVPGDEAAFASVLGGAARDAAGNRGSATPSAELDPLRAAVDAYAAAPRAAILVAPTGAAPGGLRAISGALAALAAATGHLGRRGSVFLPLPMRGNTRGALEMGATPDHLPGPCALGDEPAARRLGRAWGRAPALERGLDVARMIRDVAGLVVLADDPPVSLPSEERAREALARLDCLIVLDAFVTPTVEAAHVAFPVAAPAETEGTFTNLEGRIQWLRPAAPPPGAARPGWQVLADLGAALGLPGAPASVDDVLTRIRSAVPAYAEAPAGDGHGAPSWAWALQGLPPLPAGDAAPPAGAVAKRPGDADAAEFPLRLVRLGAFEWGDDPLVVSSPTLRRDHASLRKLFPRGLVELSGGDAKALGVRDGWQVRLVSRHGQVQIPVSLTDELEPGTVVAPFAFRDRLAPLFDGEPQVAVRVERV